MQWSTTTAHFNWLARGWVVNAENMLHMPSFCLKVTPFAMPCTLSCNFRSTVPRQSLRIWIWSGGRFRQVIGRVFDWSFNKFRVYTRLYMILYIYILFPRFPMIAIQSSALGIWFCEPVNPKGMGWNYLCFSLSVAFWFLGGHYMPKDPKDYFAVTLDAFRTTLAKKGLAITILDLPIDRHFSIP